MSARISAVLLIALALIAGTWSHDANSEIEKMVEECAKDNGVDKDALFEITVNEGDPSGANKEMKCALRCFMTRIGFMSKSGQIEEKAIRELLEGSEPEHTDAFDKCKSLKDPDHCETAYLVSKCMYDETS